jgi:hypothetical protein
MDGPGGEVFTAADYGNAPLSHIDASLLAAGFSPLSSPSGEQVSTAVGHDGFMVHR